MKRLDKTLRSSCSYLPGLLGFTKERQTFFRTQSGDITDGHSTFIPAAIVNHPRVIAAIGEAQNIGTLTGRLP